MDWTQEDLAAVNAAIRAILTGGAVASYTVDGRSLSRMSLEALRGLRKEIKSELGQALSGGGRTVVEFRRPR